MRNVKALDASRLLRQIERILQRLANSLSTLASRHRNPAVSKECPSPLALTEVEESPLGPALPA